MRSRVLWLVFGLLFAGSIEARMYQWVDPVTGSVQMSGTPPSWYRSAWGGPRVRVFENGRVVDDTAIALGEDEGGALREEAFRQFDEEKELQALQRLEKESTTETSGATAAAESGGSELDEPQGGAAAALPDAVDEQTIDKLKELIRQWDRVNAPLPEE